MLVFVWVEFVCTRACAFDEEFEWEAFFDELDDIESEECGVEGIVAEGSAEKERAGTSEDGTERPEGEVDAGGDMWGGEGGVIEDVGGHQVSDRALMAWYYAEGFGCCRHVDVW